MCRSLKSRYKFLNRVTFCRNDQRKRKNKGSTMGASLLRNPLTIYKIPSLCSSCMNLLNSTQLHWVEERQKTLSDYESRNSAKKRDRFQVPKMHLIFSFPSGIIFSIKERQGNY